MKKAKIKFTVSEVTNHTLKMKMNMVGLTKDQLYSFYPGSLRLVSLDGNAKFSSQGSYVGVQPLEDELNVNYEIEIGALGKHGRQGCITHEGAVFYGEQVFLFPLDVVASREEDLSASVCEIVVDFQLFQSSDVRVYQDPTWWSVYDLMKSSYCFKEMIDMRHNEMLIRFDASFKQSARAFEKVIQLCEYYEEIFGGTVPNLTLHFFAPIEDEEPIFGGASRCSISATFDYENKRDWQLLAHRLFHAFMDHYIPCKTLHLPPHVWLTEGITTYYELAAMDHVFGDCLELELAKLYEQYRYALMVDPYKFNIIPLDEAKLNSKGKIEFLHYIQAPLLIYYWQQSLNEHELIRYLLKQQRFDLRDVVESLLRERSDEFASYYLFNSVPLPLSCLLSSYQSEPSRLVRNLTYFDDYMASWFEGDAGGYEKKMSQLKTSGALVEVLPELIKRIWGA